MSTTPEKRDNTNPSQPKPLDKNAAPSSTPKPSMLKGASLLIILQVLSRLVTFVANQLLLRYLTAPLLGLSTQLEVYYLSVLFFARESLRVAIQRQGTAAAAGETRKDERATARKESQAVVNLGYLSIALGGVVSVGLGWTYLASAGESALETPYLVQSLYLYGTAAIIELLSEPCFVLMQTRLEFGTRAVGEGIATFLRCIVVFGTAVWASKQHLDLGVLPFALGQLSYGIALLLVYLVSGYQLSSSIGFSLFPKAVSTKSDPRYWGSYLDWPTLSLAKSMIAQSVAKHILTQGDTLLISTLGTLKTQGEYALASNYGGLLARLLFQPVEESSRSYFSRLLSSTATREPSPTQEKASAGPPPAVIEARRNLQTILKLYILLSCIVMAAGPWAAPPFFELIAGKRWAETGELIGAYLHYIPFIALNGITEAFVASVATEAEVNVQSVWMGGFSAIFGASAYLFMGVLRLDILGLLAANMINMTCRTIWSFNFIKSYFKKHGLGFSFSSTLPDYASVVVLASAIIGSLHTRKTLYREGDTPLVYLIKIAGALILYLLLMYVLQLLSPK